MDNAAVKSAITEMVGSFYREQAEKDLRKAIAERMEDEQDFKKAKFNKLSKFAYTADIEKKKQELEEMSSQLAEFGV